MGKGVSKTSKGERERERGRCSKRQKGGIYQSDATETPPSFEYEKQKFPSQGEEEEEEEDSFSRSIAFISSSVLNSLFPRLSSNYFSREAKKKKKKALAVEHPVWKRTRTRERRERQRREAPSSSSRGCGSIGKQR